MLNGILALCLRKKETENHVTGGYERQDNRVEQLTLLSRLLLYPATFFLGAGIFLGAVWAMFHGDAIGHGTERSLGIDYFPCIWCGIPFTKSADFPQAFVLPHLYDTSIPHCSDDIFRSELCLGWNA